jgi:hypothetical protein
VTAAKAAIPLVKHNARSPLSSFARRLKKKNKNRNKLRRKKMQGEMTKAILLILVKTASSALYTPTKKKKNLSKASLVGFPLLV